jgi:hypothetical protein
MPLYSGYLQTTGYKQISEYVTALLFCGKRGLDERASILRYTYLACLFFFIKFGNFVPYLLSYLQLMLAFLYIDSWYAFLFTAILLIFCVFFLCVSSTAENIRYNYKS